MAHITEGLVCQVKKLEFHSTEVKEICQAVDLLVEVDPSRSSEIRISE